MPKKRTYMNGIILGISFAVLLLAAAGTISQLEWIDSSIVTPLSDWLEGQTWMPDMTWLPFGFKWLLAGFIGAIIGFFVELR